MSTFKITAQDQIQRINLMTNQVRKFSELPAEVWLTKPSAKQWNLMEIIEHLNRAYLDYEARIDAALASLQKADQPNDHFYPTYFKRWVIEGQRPKGKVRRFKMKTFSRMDPTQDGTFLGHQELEDTIERFFEVQEKLKQQIADARMRQGIDRLKIDSAVGKWMRFYLPEAFEFLVNHEERHLVQMEEVVEEVGNLKSLGV